jgi:hypothetical protein
MLVKSFSLMDMGSAYDLNSNYEYAPTDSPPAVYEEDMTYMVDPYIPDLKLLETMYWQVRRDRATCWAAFWSDPLPPRLATELASMIIGTGVEITIYQTSYNRSGEDRVEIDWDLTELVRDWAEVAGGPDQSLNNWILPRVIEDSLAFGVSYWHHNIGGKTAPPEFKNELTLRRLDPRSIAEKRVPYDPWLRAYTQAPIVPVGNARKTTARDHSKAGLPKTQKQFDNHHPAMRAREGIVSGHGYVLFDPMRDIFHERVTKFNIFNHAPIMAALDHIKMKMKIWLMMDMIIEKIGFPPILAWLPRHRFEDSDPELYREAMKELSDQLTEFRSSDAMVFEGATYDEENQKVTDGVTVEQMKMEAHDFNTELQILDREIARAMMMSIMIVDPTGGSSNLRSPGQLREGQIQIVQTLRRRLADALKGLIAKIVFLKKNEELPLNRIVLNWSFPRETDAAIYGQIINYMVLNGTMTLPEAREALGKFGLPLSRIGEEDLFKRFGLLSLLRNPQKGRKPGSSDSDPSTQSSRMAPDQSDPSERGRTMFENQSTGGSADHNGMDTS